MNVLHITTDLGNGGAQSVLFSLVTHSTSHHHTIVTMVGGGKYQDYLHEKGYTVVSLGMKRGSLSFGAFFRLCKLIRYYKPDVIQTWMYHANVFGGLAARCMLSNKVVWGIHSTSLEESKASRLTELVIKISGWLAPFIPRTTICCSRSAVKYHAELNYPKENMKFIGNGYDVNRFVLDNTISQAESNDQLNSQTESTRTEFVTLARWDAQKDHPNLIKACGILLEKGVRDFHCTLAGSGIDENNAVLMGLLTEHKVSEHVTLLGPISTVPELLHQSDYLVLPSISEAFPNVVAEAMLSGTPCIVTDVGDAAEMVGSTGWVVEPGNSELLADKMLEAHSFKREGNLSRLEKQCKARAIDEFPVEKMVIEYEKVWNSV